MKQTTLIPNSASKTNFEVEEIPIKLFPLFRGILFLAENDIALYNSEEIFQLIDDFDVKCTLNYRNHVSAQEIADSLAINLENILINKLKSVEFYGLQIDESTDISQTKIMSLYVTYMETTPNGVRTPKVQFLKLIELKEATGLALYQAVKKYLDETNKIYGKLASICTDGASVMTGSQNGLARLIRNDIPILLSIHCMAHRINLVSNDVVDYFPILKLIDSTLYNIHKIFKRSPKRIQILEDFERLELKKTLRVLKPTKIRWFSLYNALLRMLFLWNPLVSSLDELKDTDANALGSL